jgi:hypothetical protein
LAAGFLLTAFVAGFFLAFAKSEPEAIFALFTDDLDEGFLLAFDAGFFTVAMFCPPELLTRQGYSRN